MGGSEGMQTVRVAVLQEIASRDMKLQNILLEEDVARQRPLLKVTGFGHAKVLLP